MATSAAATTTATTLVRSAVIYGAGTGVGIFFLLNNGDAVKGYAKEMGRATVHYMSRPKPNDQNQNQNQNPYNSPYLSGRHGSLSSSEDVDIDGNSSSNVYQLVQLDDGRQVLMPVIASNSWNGGGGRMINPSNPNSNPNPNPSSGPISTKLESLSQEIAQIRLMNKESNNALLGVGTTVLVIGVAGVAIYASGASLGDLMYVTKKHFTNTIGTLKEGMQGLAKAVSRVRNELAEKIGIVEAKVDDARQSIETKMEQEVAGVNHNINSVADDVREVKQNQDKVEGFLSSLETNLESQIGDLDNRAQDTQKQLLRANRGIALLCRVVADAIIAPSSTHSYPFSPESTTYSSYSNPSKKSSPNSAGIPSDASTTGTTSTTTADNAPSSSINVSSGDGKQQANVNASSLPKNSSSPAYYYNYYNNNSSADADANANVDSGSLTVNSDAHSTSARNRWYNDLIAFARGYEVVAAAAASSASTATSSSTSTSTTTSSNSNSAQQLSSTGTEQEGRLYNTYSNHSQSNGSGEVLDEFQDFSSSTSSSASQTDDLLQGLQRMISAQTDSATASPHSEHPTRSSQSLNSSQGPKFDHMNYNKNHNQLMSHAGSTNNSNSNSNVNNVPTALPVEQELASLPIFSASLNFN